jgi:hypothetical protein
MKFSFIFTTFALPLGLGVNVAFSSSTKGATNEDVTSKANADWTTGYKQVIADIAQHGFDDALEGGLPQMFCLAVPTVMPNGKIRMEYNFGATDYTFSGFL